MADYKVYEEGNNGFFIVPLNEDGTYKDSELKFIKGMVSLEGTVTQTEDKLPADDDVSYLIRRSPVTIDGTVTFMGLSDEDYDALYGNIRDKNDVLLFGSTAQAHKVGFVFFNSFHSIDALGSETVSQNAFVFNSVTFSLPDISTTTVAEDSTDVRQFELSFTANAYNYKAADGSTGRVTYSRINSIKNKDVWDECFADGLEGSKDYKMYIPDMEIGD